MQSSSFHSLPPLFLLLLALLGILVAVLQIGILGYAYEKMGISRRVAYAILIASLLGAGVNIPLVDIPGREVPVRSVEVDPWFGTQHEVVTIEEWPETSIAINLGGAIIPTALSIYLIVRNRIFGPAMIGVAAVSAVVHWLAYPVPGMGIAVPLLIPPIVSALVAIFLSRDYAAPLAYVSGCLGTLIGADLLNLDELVHMKASVASIGGAGTFDGVFLTGVLAVLLAGNPRLPQRPPAHEIERYGQSPPAGG